MEEELAQAVYETKQMAAADIAGHHHDMLVHFRQVGERNREALAFSRLSLQRMEDRDAEDWTQAREPKQD